MANKGTRTTATKIQNPFETAGKAATTSATPKVVNTTTTANKAVTTSATPKTVNTTTTAGKATVPTTTTPDKNTVPSLSTALAASVGAAVPATYSNPTTSNVATPTAGANNPLSGTTMGITPTVGVGNTMLAGLVSGTNPAKDSAYSGSINTPIPATIGGNVESTLGKRNNVARRNISLNDAISRAARNALVNSGEEIDETKPYTEVPGVGSLYASLVNSGQPAPVIRTNRLPDESRYVSDAMAESVRRSLNELGIPGTYSNNLFDQILDPSVNPLNGTIGNLATNNTSSTAGENSSGGSGSGSGSGSGRSSTKAASGTNGLNGLGGYMGGYDYSDLYDLLNARLAEYDDSYGSLMENLLNLFNQNSANFNDSYIALLNALGLNYADTEGLLRSQYENSQSELEDSRTRQLQEAYIARMMQQKNLGEQLDALGLTGGASETILADLLNNYNNNRASVEEQTRSSLRDILNNYMTNLLTARQRYNDALFNAEDRRLTANQSLLNNLYNAQNDALTNRTRMRDAAYEDLFNAIANSMR